MRHPLHESAHVLQVITKLSRLSVPALQPIASKGLSLGKRLMNLGDWCDHIPILASIANRKASTDEKSPRDHFIPWVYSDTPKNPDRISPDDLTERPQPDETSGPSHASR